MIGSLARFLRDRRGVSAIEFAFIAPVMITFYFGLAELTQALMAERRVSHAASAVGDLVAQSSAVSDGDLSDIFQISTTILEPFPNAGLKMRISSVTANAQNKAIVDWSSGQGYGPRGTGSEAPVPAGLITSGQSLIMAEVEYPYNSVLDYVINKPITFTQSYYLRPRKSDKVLKK